MLTQVDITNVRSETLSLTLMDASGGYAIKEIDGLDPVNATLTTSTLAQVDGAQPQNASRTTRNVTMKLGLEPDFLSTTVQSLRSNLYNYLMPKANIELGFYLDGSLFAKASGQVESFENAMFSADPEVDISIICYNPDFFAPADVELDSDTVSTTDTTTINYAGTSDTGVIFTLSIDRDLDDLTLYNTAPDTTIQQFHLEGTGAFVSGDILTINTIPGQKSVMLTRDSITSSVLFYVDDNAVWLSLQKETTSSGRMLPVMLSRSP